MHTYYLLPGDTDRTRGTVFNVAPVSGDHALFDTGPMFRVQYVGSNHSTLAFLDELTPIYDAPEPDWGDWWDMIDEKSAESLAEYDETGVWLTRRQVYEGSMDAAHRRVWARK